MSDAKSSVWCSSYDYIYGLPRGLSSEGKEEAKASAEACAKDKTQMTGDHYVAVASSCNISDGLPAYIPQGCYKVVNTNNWLAKIIRAFSSGK
ncbi:MAG: hypothetical protein Q7T03_05895 [Deltaproteobacteria bacterium]|nr:hypothetical protein [Deltaproteobacteria bacterium]